MNRYLITALVACQLVASVLNGIAALEIPSIFSDHMVLQRDRPVAVWGWAVPEDVVTVEFDGNEAVLHFKPDVDLATSDGMPPRGFELGDGKQPFVKVDATLRDGAVVLSIPQRTPSTEIRYAWANWPKANVQSLNGLPIAPFRTTLPD
jgi:hypothetical protein